MQPKKILTSPWNTAGKRSSSFTAMLRAGAALLLFAALYILQPPGPCGTPALATMAPPEADLTADNETVLEQENLIAFAMQPWKGDLDGMVQRRMIRVLVAYSKTHYFVDVGFRQGGMAFDIFKAFETELNRKLKLGVIKVHIVFIPVSRDRLLSGLEEGIGDIAAANLTITPERLQLVDFSEPVIRGVREIVVTGPDVPPISSRDDLVGREVIVREHSSYYEHLANLNESFAKAGKPQMRLTLASEMLEDEDLLEMVNAGIYPMTVVDNHIFTAWKKIFPAIAVTESFALNEGGEIACAFRKSSPALMTAANEFIQQAKRNTNIFDLAKKRLSSGAYIKQSTSQKELEKFSSKIELFRRYSGKYDFDWLMIIAQAYQESGLNQSARSPVGAVGIMQVLPSTASAAPISINDIEAIDNNIHAGVKYLRHIADQYFSDPRISPVNRYLFSFAAYNAGPNRIDRLRKRAAQQGLDPNQWFQNVEIVVARHVGRETTNYVGNIFKYYTAYQRFLEMKEARETAKTTGAIEATEKPQSFGKKLKGLFRR